jgi:2-polyprenyl-6-methoxyphenol hydroxylase-like FAD-dependent oxidoreductase
VAFDALHVVIAGGGLSGLALAQGLVKDGHTVEVLEREEDFSRNKQGYTLNFTGTAGMALHRVLPEDLYELYRASSARSWARRQSIVLDDQLTELGARDTTGPANDGPRNHTAVHRRALRQILQARLEGSIRYGVAVTGFEEDEDGVTVQLSNGSTTRGDLLVGADGIRSSVRAQLLPDVPVVGEGVSGIGIYGRAPLTPEIDALRPEVLRGGVTISADKKGIRLLLASFEARERPDLAAQRIAPDVQLDPVEDYFMVSCGVPPGTELPAPTEWTAEKAAVVRDAQLEALESWHPAARAIVAAQDLDSMFHVRWGYIEPAESWEPSRVTIIGDAAHAMLPTLGLGAATGLRDAAALTDVLARYGRGEVTLRSAVGEYEQDMRATTYPLLRLAADHDGTFGGGALKRLAESFST